MHVWYTPFIIYRKSSHVHYHISKAFALFFICSKGLTTIILKLLHFYGKLNLESKTALKKHTTILPLLPLPSWYVNICEYITTFNCEYIANKLIATYDNKQDILTHRRQKEIYELFVYQYMHHHHLLVK